VHPHGFRHGWALTQATGGTAMNAIQQLLGHSSLATTSTYLVKIAPAQAVAPAIANSATDAVAP
jgi:integrase